MKLSCIRVEPKSCKDVCPYKRQKTFRDRGKGHSKMVADWKTATRNTKDYQHSPETKRELEWTLSQNFHKEPTLLTPS